MIIRTKLTRILLSIIKRAHSEIRFHEHGEYVSVHAINYYIKKYVIKSMVKGILTHVAVDTGIPGVVGPIFPDNSFEFIPLNNRYGFEAKTYQDVEARNKKYGKKLSNFLPPDISKLPVHFDPDFQNFTYGQHGGEYSKVIALEKLKKGDYLFFLASLAPFNKEIYKDKRLIKEYQVGRKNKHLIGFFKLDAVAKVDALKSQPNLALALLNFLDKESPLEHTQFLKEYSKLEELGYIRKEEKGFTLNKNKGDQVTNGEEIIEWIFSFQESENNIKSIIEKGKIKITSLSGEFTEDDVRINHHYTRLRELDADSFTLFKGAPKSSKLLEKTVQLTTKYQNNTYLLNKLGQRIFEKKTDPLRGIRWLNSSQIELILSSISLSRAGQKL